MNGRDVIPSVGGGQLAEGLSFEITSEAVCVNGVLVQLPCDLREHLRAIEEAHIARALEVTRGNNAKAAKLLGLKRTTLLAKLTRAPR